MESKDKWAVGDLYEPYVGRWSRLVAKEFVTWLSVPDQREWLDVGCGTGALTQAILEAADPRTVRGIDPSAGFVDYARERISSPLASFEVGDARSIALDDDSVDVAVSGLVLNFVPDPSIAVAEMVRVVRPEGTVAAYVWDYAGKMELMRYFWDAAVALVRARRADEYEAQRALDQYTQLWPAAPWYAEQAGRQIWFWVLETRKDSGYPGAEGGVASRPPR